jgi:hypothetical protein
MTTVRRAMALLALVLVVTTGLLLPAPAAASQHASGRFSPDVAAGGSPAASSPWSVAVVYVQAGTATSGCSVQRYYDPGTGQFMSVDPLNELTNAGYSFVEDNPLDGTDPTGEIYLENGGSGGAGCGTQCASEVEESESSSNVSQSTAAKSTNSGATANGCTMTVEAPPATSNYQACQDSGQGMTGPGGFTSSIANSPGPWGVLFYMANVLAFIGGDPVGVPDDDPTDPDPVNDPAEPVSVPAAQVGPGASITNILEPGGNLIGKAGSDASIRELSGGLADAQAMFDQLSQGGKVVEQTPYLTRVALPDGGFVQLRTVMSRSPNSVATIDVNIPGLDITKVKFNP